MKKFNKSGHLKGNADVPFHGNPFLQGTEPANSSEFIVSLQGLSTPWSKELHIETGTVGNSVSFVVTLTDVNTTHNSTAGHLPTIVSFINNLAANTNGPNTFVTASIKGGALLLKSNFVGEDSFIRIFYPTTANYPSAASDFGFLEHPHSQATVYGKDLISSATNTISQKNPTGTTLVAKGEDRSSVSYNRGLYSVASNTDVNNTMLNKPIAHMVTMSISPTSARLLVDSASNTVTAIDLSSTISDNYSSLLENRILVGTLTRNSSIRHIRNLFQITDGTGKEISYGVGKNPVRVSSVTTGKTTINPAGPFTLDSVPSVNADSTVIGDGGNALSVSIPRGANVTAKAITGFIDSYTIESSSAQFLASNVAVGDTLTIEGSTTNNGDYTVENIIKETLIEVRPAVYSNIRELNTSDVTGTVTIKTGGMWLKDVTIHLTERIQLPIQNNIHITIPLESTIGDLDDSGPISERGIETPFWVVASLYNKKSLDSAYDGILGKGGAGYYIDTDIRPIEIKPVYKIAQSGTVVRSLSSATILADNVIELTLNNSDSFLEEDLGRVLSLTVTNPSVASDSVLLNGEKVVIVELLDAKRVIVRKVSRTSSNLPQGTITSMTVLEDDAFVSFPGYISSIYSEDITTGGESKIIDTISSTNKLNPSVYNTDISLTRIHKTSLTDTNPVVLATIESLTTLSLNIDGTYISVSYPFTGPAEIQPYILFCRVHNGSNCGWYIVKSLTRAQPSVLEVANLDGSTVNLAQDSGVTVYTSLYFAQENSAALATVGNVAFNAIAQKTLFSVSESVVNPATSLAIGWKGEGAGITITSNIFSDPSDIYLGASSKGRSITSMGGPGSGGIYSYTKGMDDFDQTLLNSNAEYLLTDSVVRGLSSFYGDSQTYWLSPTKFSSSSFNLSYRGGAALFESSTDDQALVAAKGSTNLNKYLISTAAAVFIAKSGNNGIGKHNTAVGLFGGVYAPKVTYTDTIYTEHVGSFTGLQASQSNSITIDQPSLDSNKLGAGAVIGRFSASADSLNFAKIGNRDLDKFNIQHDLVLTLVVAGQYEDSTLTYPSFIDVNDKSELLGCHVFFARVTTVGDSAFDSVNSALDNTLYDLPFRLDDYPSIQGAKHSFKIVAISAEISSNWTYQVAIQCELVNFLTNMPSLSPLSEKIDCIIYRPRFSGHIDLGNYTRIGNSHPLEARAYSDTSSTSESHRDPVLFTKELDNTPDISDIVVNNKVQSYASNLTTKVTKTTMRSPNETLNVGDLLEPNSNSQNAFRVTVENVRYQDPEYKNQQYQSTNSNVEEFTPSFNANDLAYPEHSVSLSGHTLFVSSDNVSIRNQIEHFCFTANSGSKLYRGGGSKLVITGAPENPDVVNIAGDRSINLSIPLGANLSKNVNGFTLKMKLQSTYIDESNPEANVNNVDVVLYAFGKSLSLASKRISLTSLAQGANLTTQVYQTISVSFSKDDLEAVKDYSELNESHDQPNLMLVLLFTVEEGFKDFSSVSGIANLPMEIKAEIAYGTAWANIAESGSISPSYQSNKYPSAIYISSIDIEYDKKQAAFTSGIDVDGPLQPRSLRLLSPAVGYQVIGPSSVDLLQNSEYGNGLGNNILYDDESMGPSGTDIYRSHTVGSQFGTDATNLEGRDVGLLPLWFSFYPTAFRNTMDSMPLSILDDESDDWAKVEPIPVSDKIIESTYRGNSGLAQINYSTAFYMNKSYVPAFFTTELFLVTGDSAESTAYPITLYTPTNETGAYVQFNVPVTITKFFRPKFDKSSFFRKGVHSAAIHAHIPYFDPLFYWVAGALSVNRGKTHLTNDNETVINSTGISIAGSDKFDAGSFRLNTGVAYKKMWDSGVNPDSYVLPGRTGFVVPIDPPHGSRLTQLDLKMSFRPSCTREATGSDDLPGDLHVTYGVYHSLPSSLTSSSEQTTAMGHDWMNRGSWQANEGYLIRVWRHSPFDDNFTFGESPDVTQLQGNVHTDVSKNMEGNATLLYEQKVNLRTTDGGNRNGALGIDPSVYLDSANHRLSEGISNVRIAFEDMYNPDRHSPKLLVDRARYSYFITIEFYTGVRKAVTQTDDNGGSHLAYSVPGYSYGTVDYFNNSYAPYMWTSAFPERRPTKMSTVYGNDYASPWEGYMVPYPHNSVLDNNLHPTSIYRRHKLNAQPEDATAASDIGMGSFFQIEHFQQPNANPRLSKNITRSALNLMPTPSTGDGGLNIFAGGSTGVSVIEGSQTTSLDSSSNNTNYGFLVQTRTVPNHLVWYPVIKFRGLRITYETDRPGHGGWAG